MKFLMFITLLFASNAFSKTLHYELTIEQKPINITGNKTVDFSLMVNGGIPAPILQFTEGDDAEIVVHNKSKEETSVHWHGLLVPNEMDGVPYVTNPPIAPGADYTFKFPIRQSGTYWYHSHTHTQEQRGVYGSIVIHPKTKPFQKVDADTVLLLSDWIDEDPDQAEKNLHKDGGYYLQKKGTRTSWLGAILAQNAKTPAVKNYFLSEWSKMGAMDFSDIGYDAFLINGVESRRILPDAQAGSKLKFRVINGGSSSYFYFSISGLPFQVVAADGKDIVPVMTKEILIGMAETYDVVFTVPENQSYEVRSSAQDGTGFASVIFGQGKFNPAPTKPIPNPYAMNHANHTGHASHEMPMANMEHMHHMGHAAHEVKITEQLTYDDLRALNPVTFPKEAKHYEFKLVLSGDMERYYWQINGKSIAEERSVFVNEGDVVKFVFVNESMMNHPMHLHGHFFKVLRLGVDPKDAPMKHTVDVPPFATQEIEFLADEKGEWLLHCHNLFHMMSGMARVVSYTNFVPKPEVHHLQSHDPHAHDPLYWKVRADLFSHAGELSARVNNSKLEGSERLELKREEGWKPELDLFGRRYLDFYTDLFIGGELFNGLDDTNRFRGLVGIRHKLPLLIEASAMLGSNLRPRFDLGKRVQWATNIYSDIDVRFRWLGTYGDVYDLAHQKSIDWAINLMYSLTWHWSVGFRLDPHSAGVGLSAQL